MDIITKARLQEGLGLPFGLYSGFVNTTADGRPEHDETLWGPPRCFGSRFQERTPFRGAQRKIHLLLHKRAGEISQRSQKRTLRPKATRNKSRRRSSMRTARGRKARGETVHIQQEVSQLVSAARSSPAKSTCRTLVVKTGRRLTRRLEYYRHLVSKVDVTRLRLSTDRLARLPNSPGEANDRFLSHTLAKTIVRNETKGDRFLGRTKAGSCLARSKPVVDFLSPQAQAVTPT